jgi:branched-chain amino acid transport system substrate-binding protein
MARNKVCAVLVFVVYMLFYSIDVCNAEIKIGMMVSSPDRPHMKYLMKAVELAIKSANSRLVISNGPISLVLEDDNGNPRDGMQAARRLIEKEKVSMVIGSMTPSVAIATAQEFSKSGIVLINPFCEVPELTDDGLKYVFRLSRNDSSRELIGVIKRVGDMYLDKKIFVWSSGGENPYVSEFCSTLQHERIACQVNKQDESIGSFLSQSSHVTQNIVVNMGGADISSEVFKSSGINRDNTLVIQYRYVRIPKSDIDRSPLSNIVTDMAREGVSDDHVVRLGFQAFAAVQVWSEAINVSRSVDADAVSRYIKSNRFDTALGKISFNENGDVCPNCIGSYDECAEKCPKQCRDNCETKGDSKCCTVSEGGN